MERPTRYTGVPARKSVTLRLVHKPTGVEVSLTADGPFTRKAAKIAKARLYEDAWTQLTKDVGRALRVPGR